MKLGIDNDQSNYMFAIMLRKQTCYTNFFPSHSLS